jgi:hypothetical protein
MGDRGNIAIQNGTKKSRVYLYTHWNGSNIQAIARRALAKKWRWSDEAYLTRIVFCELVKGFEDDETGYGISTSICDNAHPILVLDAGKGSCWLENESGGVISNKMMFGSFCEGREFILKNVPNYD